MPVTLAEASKNVQDALQMGVIDEFRKSNFLLNTLTFDDAVSPTGGGTTLTYSYTRLKTQPTADFREVNMEYTPHEVEKEQFHTTLKIFGGSYQIDRVIADMGGIVKEVILQSSQKIKGAQALFNDTVINGDSAVNAKAFDGLEKALAGSSTEYKPAAPIDLSISSALDTNYKAFLDQLDEFLLALDGQPGAIMGNTKLIAKIRAVARRSGQYQETKDDFGRNVSSYDSIPLVDLGAKAGSNDPVVNIDATAGTTSLYAVRFGLDGFHAVSAAGGSPIKTWLPDFTTSGAVKTGEVEMLAAVALKATKAAGVFRDIKVK
ncbi:phage capsid protein [Bacillaceae bacterium Marseille-Q3522]|nr:phage capsid protein [Bacillaceae bacterium Marseille-Q3522]